MPGIQPHIVGKINLELQFSGILYDKLMLEEIKKAVLEKVNSTLDQMPESAESYIRIDHLDIELRSASFGAFPALLEDKLKRILREKVGESENMQAGDQKNENPQNDRLWLLFIYYLKRGFLPWNTAGGERLDFHQVAQLLNGTDGLKRIDELHIILGSSTAAKRFCFELPQSTIDEIISTGESVLAPRFKKVEKHAFELFHLFSEQSGVDRTREEPVMRWILYATLRINHQKVSSERFIIKEIIKLSFEDRPTISTAAGLSGQIEGTIDDYLKSDRPLLENVYKKPASDKEKVIAQSLQLLRQGIIDLDLDDGRKKQLVEILKMADQTSFGKRTSRESENKVEKASDETDSTKRIYIDNAGLILLHPYLLPLFQEFDLCDHQSFNSIINQQLAVIALQQLAGMDTKHRTGLALNKILCGLEVSATIPIGIQPESAWSNEFEKLLKSTIVHWKALKNTSVEGFRDSFLQRQGILEVSPESQKLVVEKKPYDVLLERLPWSIGVIKLPWMAQPLWVDW